MFEGQVANVWRCVTVKDLHIHIYIHSHIDINLIMTKYLNLNTIKLLNLKTTIAGTNDCVSE